MKLKSNFVTPLAAKNHKKIERLAISSRKRRCLFGTMEVKMALAIITVFYMLALAVMNNYVYWKQLSDLTYIILGVSSIIALLIICLAQLGLHRENYYLIIPFFIAQILFSAVIYGHYSRQIFAQLKYANSHRHVAMRLIMLMLYETILIAMHSYTLMITFRTMYYFHQKKIRRESIDGRPGFKNCCFIDRLPNPVPMVSAPRPGIYVPNMSANADQTVRIDLNGTDVCENDSTTSKPTPRFSGV